MKRKRSCRRTAFTATKILWIPCWQVLSLWIVIAGSVIAALLMGSAVRQVLRIRTLLFIRTSKETAHEKLYYPHSCWIGGRARRSVDRRHGLHPKSACGSARCSAAGGDCRNGTRFFQVGN